MLTIRFWGVTSDVSGLRHTQFPLVRTAGQLRKKLEENYPGLSKWYYLLLVNGEKPGEQDLLRKDDRVDLIPPFAGG